jgi:hypothetical protein
VRTISSGEYFFANWADFPSLTELADGTLLAHWLRKSAPDSYAYDILLARSRDGSAWEVAGKPHRDGTPTEHGFLSVVPGSADGATLLWLDGRDYAGKEHDDAQTRLMSTRLTPNGFSEEVLVDERVCDCCQTAAVAVPGGLLVAYRDRSAHEVRDISLRRFADDAWSAASPLAEDGWEIAGCPVNGPALAAEGSRVVAAWFTAADDSPRVQVAISKDGGRSFPLRAHVDDGAPLGRVDVVLLPRGGALVCWLESGAEGSAALRARHIRADGRMEPSFAVATTRAARASGFPRLERSGRAVYFAWTESSEPSQVRMAVLDLPGSW